MRPQSCLKCLYTYYRDAFGGGGGNRTPVQNTFHFASYSNIFIYIIVGDDDEIRAYGDAIPTRDGMSMPIANGSPVLGNMVQHKLHEEAQCSKFVLGKNRELHNQQG